MVRVFDVLAEIREQVHDRDGRAAVRISRALRHERGEDERFLARRAADRQAVSVERRIVLAYEKVLRIRGSGGIEDDAILRIADDKIRRGGRATRVPSGARSSAHAA